MRSAPRWSGRCLSRKECRIERCFAYRPASDLVAHRQFVKVHVIAERSTGREWDFPESPPFVALRKRIVDCDINSPHESWIDVAHEVGCEHDESTEDLEALQKIGDLQICIAVPCVADFCSATKQRIGFIEEEHLVADRGGIKHLFEIFLGLSDVLAHHRGKVNDEQIKPEFAGDNLSRQGLAGSRVTRKQGNQSRWRDRRKSPPVVDRFAVAVARNEFFEMTAPVIVENEVVPASAGSNSAGESVDWSARESANRPVEVTVAAGGDFGCPFELLRRQPVSEPVDVERRTRWTTRRRPLDRRWHEILAMPGREVPWWQFRVRTWPPMGCAQHARSSGATAGRSSVASMQMPAPRSVASRTAARQAVSDVSGGTTRIWSAASRVPARGVVVPDRVRSQTRVDIAHRCSLPRSRTGSGLKFGIRSSLACQGPHDRRLDSNPSGHPTDRCCRRRGCARARPDPAPTVIAPGCCFPRSLPRRSRLILVAAGSSWSQPTRRWRRTSASTATQSARVSSSSAESPAFSAKIMNGVSWMPDWRSLRAASRSGCGFPWGPPATRRYATAPFFELVAAEALIASVRTRSAKRAHGLRSERVFFTWKARYTDHPNRGNNDAERR